MPRSDTSVTVSAASSAYLPDGLAPYAHLALDLDERGVLDELMARVRIRRKGGFVGFDVFMLLLAYYSSARSVGLKGFISRSQPFLEKLAALAGRKSLPTQSSVSRALRNVESSMVHAQLGWLLRTATGVAPVLAHPTANSRDANGERWFVVDFDGKVKAFRHRGLAQGEDYPDVLRVTGKMSQPGYSGRKRGESQVMSFKTVHRGSQACLAVLSASGNGPRRAAVVHSIGHVLCAAEEAGFTADRTLFVADGAHGNVPDMTSLRSRKVPFLTRLTRPHFALDEAFRQQLRDAVWHRVPDTGSGPTRFAAELGVLRVAAGESTLDEEGRPYDPVDVRVVVSRYIPRDTSSSKKLRGFLLGEWQYELFAADVCERAWPASDICGVYFDRSRQENRFHRENIEVNADRVLSYHLGGYELTQVVAHMVANLQLARGFALAEPPAKEPELESRTETPTSLPLPPSRERIEEPPHPSPSPSPTELDALEAELAQMLRRLAIDRDTLRESDWTWDSETAQMTCPDGHLAALSGVTLRDSPRVPLHFRISGVHCDGCPVRTGCNTSAVPRKAKQRACSIDRSEAVKLDLLLEKVRMLRRHERSRRTIEISEARQQEAAAARRPIVESVPGPRLSAGPWETTSSRFLPSKARSMSRARFHQSRVHVRRDPWTKAKNSPRLVAGSRRAISKRRATWAERNAVNALPDGCRVEVHIETFGQELVANGPSQGRKVSF